MSLGLRILAQTVLNNSKLLTIAWNEKWLPKAALRTFLCHAFYWGLVTSHFVVFIPTTGACAETINQSKKARPTKKSSDTDDEDEIHCVLNTPLCTRNMPTIGLLQPFCR
jgi:hypothetical protein